eukprot:7146703-Alexandrium_andersonii.AAC.1
MHADPPSVSSSPHSVPRGRTQLRGLQGLGLTPESGVPALIRFVAAPRDPRARQHPKPPKGEQRRV